MTCTIFGVIWCLKFGTVWNGQADLLATFFHDLEATKNLEDSNNVFKVCAQSENFEKMNFAFYICF